MIYIFLMPLHYLLLVPLYYIINRPIIYHLLGCERRLLIISAYWTYSATKNLLITDFLLLRVIIHEYKGKIISIYKLFLIRIRNQIAH